jgi:hypothetical protein
VREETSMMKKMRVESNRNQEGKSNERKKEVDINRPKYRYEEIIKKIYEFRTEERDREVRTDDRQKGGYKTVF